MNLILFLKPMSLPIYYFQEQNKCIWRFSFRLIYHNKTRNLSTIAINVHNSTKLSFFLYMPQTQHISQKYVLNLVKITQYSSLNQTCHELIFFSSAESLQFLFLDLCCLLPKYMALASQHFLPALTEVGCFDFSLKCFRGTEQASKGRSLSSDMHLQGSCSWHLAFLQGVISHLLMRALSAPFWRAEWSYYPYFTDGEAELGSLASAEVPATLPPATSHFCRALLKLTPCSRDRHPSQKSWGCSLAYCHHIMVSHFTPSALRSAPELQGTQSNSLILNFGCPMAPTRTAATEQAMKSCVFQINGTGVIWIPYTNPKWLVDLTWKLPKMLNCVVELRSGRR